MQTSGHVSQRLAEHHVDVLIGAAATVGHLRALQIPQSYAAKECLGTSANKSDHRRPETADTDTDKGGTRGRAIRKGLRRRQCSPEQPRATAAVRRTPPSRTRTCSARSDSAPRITALLQR